MSAMAAGGLLVGLFLAVGIGGGVVLYVLVRAEHDRRDVVDREEAERLARRDGPEQP